jgi:hypothetical protein
VVMATLIGSSMRVAVSKGYPRGGGVLLPLLLQCLVMDELIARLSGCGIYVHGYVDDISLLVVGKFPCGVRAHALGPSNC